MTLVSPTQVSDGSTIDASDVNTPINQLAAVINGNIDNSNIVSGAAIDGAKLAANSIDIGAKASTWDGWIAVTDTWTYASSTTVTVPSDATAKYSVGDKVRFTNSGTKYFYITAVSSTVLTLNGGSDYTVANAAITVPYYSKAETPVGFPTWFNFTPNFPGTTLGSGTVAGFFAMCGKVVHFRASFVLGAGSAVSAAQLTLPITAATYVANETFGNVVMSDVSAGFYYLGPMFWASTTVVTMGASVASGTYLTLSGTNSTIPFTWATGDGIYCNGTYKAA